MNTKAACNLTLALRDGFAHDEIRILADGKEVAHLEDVTTRLQISLAREVAIQLDDKLVEIIVELPQKQLHVQITIDPLRTCFLAVDIDPVEGKVKLTPSKTPFRYM